MAQQIARCGVGIRADVEDLVGPDSRVRTCGDVSYRVTARFTRGETGFGQPSHRRLHVVQLHEVKLDVLTRGDVSEATRILLTDIGERIELRLVEDPLRNLDAQHLNVAGLPLAVRAADEPERAPAI